MDFTQDGYVSVWLAGRIGEEQLAAYLEPRSDDASAEEPPDRPISAFAEEFGIGWYDHDFLEACFEPDPRSVGELLEGVSFGTSFVEAIVQIAGQAGMAMAGAAVLLYDCCYSLDPETAARKTTFQFIGAFPYDADAE
jgi:hypothetical protein